MQQVQTQRLNREVPIGISPTNLVNKIFLRHRMENSTEITGNLRQVVKLNGQEGYNKKSFSPEFFN